MEKIFFNPSTEIIDREKIVLENNNLNPMNQNEEIILLRKGFHFNLKTEKLFCNNLEINLTKTELRLFKLLITNLNNITKIEDIAELVWKKKNFSRSLLRAYIKKIRDKLYPSLIVTKSNVGYKIVN